MVDSNENILVEFDYDNITIIDPNKVVDNLGNVNLISHLSITIHKELTLMENLEQPTTDF